MRILTLREVLEMSDGHAAAFPTMSTVGWASSRQATGGPTRPSSRRYFCPRCGVERTDLDVIHHAVGVDCQVCGERLDGDAPPRQEGAP